MSIILSIDFSQYDYVVDAVDTVKGKLALVEQARDAHTPIICSVGAGNKPRFDSVPHGQMTTGRLCAPWPGS